MVANSHGFRDAERSVAKPAGVVRIALLGDSMVEALQLPLEKTAGGLLEGWLGPGYEVLNFGVSNYGIGQYLLVWEAYARRFEPDVVFALAAPYLMRRSVKRFEQGAFPSTSGRSLWVRPTFRLEGGELVREPARDFDAFAATQRRLVEEVRHGERMQRRPRGLFLADLLHPSPWQRLLQLERRLTAPARLRAPMRGTHATVGAGLIDLNLAILEELAASVASTGARLVLVDASLYFQPAADEAAEALGELCARVGCGPIDLSARLLDANERGVATRWSHDGHFNEAAHRIFAAALRDWLASNEPRHPGTLASP